MDMIDRQFEKLAVQILTRPYMWQTSICENGAWLAAIAEFNGCCASGQTAEESIANLRQFAVSWLVTCLAHGIDIPEPESKK